MRLWWLAAFAVLSACGSQPALPARPAPWKSADFEPIKLRAMASLAEDAADPGGTALAMEGELDAFVDRAAAADDGGRLTAAEDREGAGLALVYRAMVLLHDADAVEAGKIPAARLYGARRYDASGGSLTDAAAVRAEGNARRRRAGELLRRAQRLRPGDGRIASWIAAAAAHEHTLPSGEIPDADQGALLQAVEVEPLFNLFTAIIMLRHDPPGSARYRALVARTGTFLQARMCKAPAPGSKEARYCQDTPLAPRNEEAATVILSDVFARAGEEALRRGDVPGAMPALGMARGLLGTLDDDAHRRAMSGWKYAPFVDARRKRLAALAPGQPLPDASFWRSDAYERMYACAACHTR